MHFIAVAADYDGTLAESGSVSGSTQVHQVEEEASVSAEDSRCRVAQAIEERYTLPA